MGVYGTSISIKLINFYMRVLDMVTFSPADPMLIEGAVCLTYLGWSELGREDKARDYKKAYFDMLDYFHMSPGEIEKDQNSICKYSGGMAYPHPEYKFIGMYI